MSIEVCNITKTFGTFTALKDVSLTVQTGELVALLGPSGSGKTTLLRIIAGLEFPDSGVVLLGGEEATQREARERRVGFVFQHYALFRHMTVFENVAFGLRVRPRKRRPADGEIRNKVQQLLKLVQLDWLANRVPSQLSGGQRQRVALARALAVEPQVLLLDEPFGSLDAKVRQELRRWIRRLHEEIHITSVFVTHDQEEALEVADRVVIMNEGHIEQIGTPEEVYDHPATPFVYNFLGKVNLFHGRVEGGRAYISDLVMELSRDTQPDAERTVVYVRPHELDIALQPQGQNHFRARVKHINLAGPLAKVELITESGHTIHVEMSQECFRERQLKRDIEVFVSPKEMKIFTNDHPSDSSA